MKTQGRVARPGQLWLVLLAAVASMVALAPAAQAGTTKTCPTNVVSTPFASAGDSSHYFLAPGGSFEPGSPGWSLGGANVVGGNESFYLHGSGDVKSLRISPGTTVTAPAICITPDIPSLRFVVKSAKDANSPGNYSQLNVSVLIKNSAGSQLTYYLGQLNGTDYGSWTFSPQLSWGKKFDSWLFQADGTATLQLVLNVQGQGGTWYVDDVYVDPFMGR